MRYRCIGVDGKEYGPFEVAQLLDLRDQGRIRDDSLVAAEGGAPWATLSSVLSAGARGAAPASPPPPPPPMAPAPVAGAEDVALALVVPVSVDPVALLAGYAGIFALFLIGGPFALGLGLLALRRLNADPRARGRGRAWFGVITGAIATLAIAVMVVFALSR